VPSTTLPRASFRQPFGSLQSPTSVDSEGHGPLRCVCGDSHIYTLRSFMIVVIAGLGNMASVIAAGVGLGAGAGV
jgi:hypothetical protein